MARNNRIRASDKEYALLKEIRDERYPELPMGAVIRMLVQEARS